MASPREKQHEHIGEARNHPAGQIKNMGEARNHRTDQSRNMIEFKRVGGNGHNTADQHSTHQKTVNASIKIDKIGRYLPVEVVDQLLHSTIACLDLIMDPLNTA